MKAQNFRSAVCWLTVFLIFQVLTACGISLGKYQHAEENLVKCISGVKLPADGFCIQYSNAWAKANERMNERLERLKQEHPKKFERLSAEVEAIRKNYDTALKKLNGKF